MGFPRVALGTSAGCCVTSPGSRVGIGAVCCWFRDVTALARSWTLQLVGFSRCQGESPADRLPGRPCAESDEQEK